MEDWAKLMPWISELSGDDLQGDWMSELWDGVLLCQIVNGIEKDKITINLDFENDERAAVSNLENFLWAAQDLGVDKAHLFELEQLEENPDPDAELLDQIRECLAALKSIAEQRGTLEKQNIWRKDAAEVRANQRTVRNDFAKKDDKTLSDVTHAVKNFKASTNPDADLRYQRKGQQKWNLFETNYQREKGISLEQSLKEIEEFERTGKVPESMKKKSPVKGAVGTSGFRTQLEITINRDKDGKDAGQNTTSSTFSNRPGLGSSTAVKGAMIKGGRSELSVKPQMGGGKGAAFFQQFAEQEKRKFKPGAGPSKKLW